MSDQFEDTEATKEQRYNEIIRGSANAGLSILELMQEDLVLAWVSHDAMEEGDKKRVARGRIRGIAQMIALIRSPYSRRDLGAMSRRWMNVIKQTEDEGHARARLRTREG